MEDTRTPLLPGTQLNFGEGKNVTIKELIGKGGNCLVYYASYCDNRKADHYVRIKECYPYNLPLKRETEGGLVVVHGKEREMIAAKERFFQAYDRNVTFQKLHGLVNSTGIVNELFEVNNTVYSMLSFVEGTDYGKYEDRTLKEALEHILAVAKVLKKYHEQGYLHLDIKPENIFVIPETAQHIQLFDFDSVVTTEELLEDSYLFSVSDGFAAPEQVQGRINKITPATDIYSLGATLFYKLFGRCVEAKDGMLNTALDFSNLVFKEEQGKYSVGLLKGLQTIFEKSIAVSPVIRWKEMDEFIQKLESLLPLADTERVTVKANFSYASRYFVGREKLLEEMEAALNDCDAIVLSGIGGIGKTELAKKYAHLHKEEIEENGGRILFVPFTKSIRETICGNDIVIVNEGQNTEVKEAELFETRMRILREELTKNDLFILDNFDVEPDEDFELLREVGCKFILTSRCDFRDYNYRQLEVDQLGSEEEVYELFFAYNDKVYTDEDRKALSELFWIIEYHTMTIELLAKHLRDTEEIPEVMLERLKEKEGITNIPDVTIRHLKDRKPRAESINRHLLFLFDLSVFTAKESESEAELMRSLSLLGYVRILKDSFLEYCNVKQKEEGLGHLIRTGWVEFDAETDKISLHQVILDLVYHHMNPTAENCPHLVEAMCMYMQAETETYVEKANRRRLVRNVLSRLQGDSVS